MDLNLNQFAQVPILGQLDLQISKSGVISGTVDASQATALVAGQPVKLYGSNTSSAPTFVAAGDTDVAIGHVVFDKKKASPEAGDVISVAGNFGPVMFLEAGETITPGVRVQNQDTDNTVMLVTDGKVRGIALDYGTVGTLIRVILLTPVTAAS
jgi:hypothetical protein